MTLAERAFPLFNPLLQVLDAETAHRLAIAALRLAPMAAPPKPEASLRVDAFGQRKPGQDRERQ